MAVAVAWCHGAHLLLLLFPLLQTEMQDRLMERDEHSRALGCPGLLCLWTPGRGGGHLQKSVMQPDTRGSQYPTGTLCPSGDSG